MARDNDDSESKGIALAGMALAMATLSFLEARRIISAQDEDRILEIALSSLEDSPDATTPGYRKARALVDAIMQSAVARRHT